MVGRMSDLNDSSNISISFGARVLYVLVYRKRKLQCLVLLFFFAKGLMFFSFIPFELIVPGTTSAKEKGFIDCLQDALLATKLCTFD